jgi:hypothetical protein
MLQYRGKRLTLDTRQRFISISLGVKRELMAPHSFTVFKFPPPGLSYGCAVAILLGKLAVAQLVMKYPALYSTLRTASLKHF